MKTFNAQLQLKNVIIEKMKKSSAVLKDQINLKF